MSDLFYIASLKHTHREHEHIGWWGKNRCGYTPVLGEHVGEYTAEEAAKLNNGLDHIAVPVDVVRGLSSPEPYFRPTNPMRFYDQRGPVVENSRDRWNQLIDARLPPADGTPKPKPQVFKGARRSFSPDEDPTP